MDRDAAGPGDVSDVGQQPVGDVDGGVGNVDQRESGINTWRGPVQALRQCCDLGGRAPLTPGEGFG
ncbi:MAG: hypothetical protein A2579_13785 [Lysobacterales bacterium RIFOXYD1_FULL_69_11]|nr:MAG: hypothetical protein A2579_13785 [Xanthomonadales bacterium RIFOXYD1_FULL_69_11]